MSSYIAKANASNATLNYRSEAGCESIRWWSRLAGWKTASGAQSLGHSEHMSPTKDKRPRWEEKRKIKRKTEMSNNDLI